MVKLDSDFSIMECEIKGDSMVKYNFYTYQYPRSNLPIPNLFRRQLGKYYVTHQYINIVKVFGRFDHKNRPSKGFKGTPYEKFIKNIDKSENLAAYKEFEKDMLALIQSQDFKRPMAKL